MINFSKIAIVRGKYLNQFEMQNYAPLAKGSMTKIVAFSSLKPIHENIGFPVKKLPSLMDLPNFPYKLPILNRLMIDAMYLVGLEKALKGFDLVCARETYFHFTQQALNAKKKGYVKKVLVTCSETIPFNHESIWGRKKFKQSVIHEADHFHCLTQKAKQCLIKEGCDPKKITVIGYGVNLDRFKPKSLDTKYKILNTRVLFVGRLVKEKGILDLLEACQNLAGNSSALPQNDDIELQIIGKEPLGTRIRARSFSRCFGRDQDDGMMSYENMPKVYQNADIFVLPSKPTKYWEEYYGMAILEAMASGLPIISTKSGAIPEIIGKAGILVKPGNIQELKQALLQLIKVKKMRQKLGREARKRAEKFFDAKKQAQKIAKLWKWIIKM